MTPSAPLALLIEDDDQIRRLIRGLLASSEFRLLEVATISLALEAARWQHPDIVLSELNLPDMAGPEVITGLRRRTSAPILVVSDRSRERDKVRALEAGADDYVTKPFGGAELLARMRAVLRRAVYPAREGDGAVITVGELQIDLSKRVAFARGGEVHLTPLEYKLFAMLMTRAGSVVAGKDLLHQIWGPEFADRSDYLRVYVSQLRQKLESDPTHPRYLVTEPNVGYRIRLVS